MSAVLRCDVTALMRVKLCRLPRAEHWAGDLALIARRFGCDAAALGNALDQVAGDLVYLTMHAATPELAARAAEFVRTNAGRQSVVDQRACLAAGGYGWVVYARLDLGASSAEPLEPRR